MEQREKTINRIRLGLALQTLIDQHKRRKEKNSVTSLRKLAAASGVEYSIIQKISSGKKDPQFTTLLAIAEGLNISITELLSQFEKTTHQVAVKQINDLPVKKKKK